MGRGKKEKGRKDREERKVIRCLCAILYLFCVLNLTGISLDFTVREKMHYNTAEKVKETAAGQVPGEVPEYGEGAKKIALTFDDGPNIACTGRLLDGLKERNVRATFFVIGKNVKANPKLTKRISEEGHMIGNHTYSHIDMSKVSEKKAGKELKKTSRAVHAITGEYPQYMRPPYGVCSRKLEESLDMILVRWTIDPLDWKTENTDEIVKKVVTKTEENDIILLHDCYNSSVDAALKIIDILKKEGYEFVTVDELFLN
ncbi:MAG: polysaccharide deacetylase family protein [Dorea sp.]|nr:polysaccharide deacetylase family protein [Dorea sp.]